jgi:hypothetical protein
MPANRTTVELDRPLNTCLAGINPNKPQAIEPAIAVTARGIISVMKNKAMTASKIKHFVD